MERSLRSTLLPFLRQLKESERVVLAFTLPVNVDTYAHLVNHPKVLRVLAISDSETTQKELFDSTGLLPLCGPSFFNNLSAKQSVRRFGETLQASVQSLCKQSIDSCRNQFMNSDDKPHRIITPSTLASPVEKEPLG
eukprot:TRINITY_DN83760_c0_g1_i1.p1 TRINITY_DN83760_c0_g1~~TRINITY_DN83760_c0_g1_i1.p1  ORF type:complete len:152 (-),score=15.35 TRINITY_DN83760_c0_g1_i1:1-411(-)